MLNSKFIGNKIAEARKMTNLSQAMLAQEISISPQAVGKWERGESMPDIMTLNKLAKIFEVDLNYFSINSPIDNNDRIVNSNAEDQTKPQKKIRWSMSAGNWVDANFSGLSNLKDKFSNSNIKKCKFIESDLSDLVLSSNSIKESDFSKSSLQNSKLRASKILSNSFEGCNFTKAIFSANKIKSCNFSKADFSESEIKSTELNNCKLLDAIWNQTSFNTSNISDVVFNGEIIECSFVYCEFLNVTFKNATLLKTFFKGNKFNKVNFINCKVDQMTYEFLKANKANLTGLILLS